MWYKRKMPERVYGRRIQKREAITVSRAGYETAPDKSITYSEGDYIVFEEGKGIYFMKGDDFKKEFDTTID
jgi:hypothetical protein